jgi:hypothetical protein
MRYIHTQYLAEHNEELNEIQPRLAIDGVSATGGGGDEGECDGFVKK